MKSIKPKITAVVVNWNQVLLLKQCVKSLLNSVNIELQVYVIDNGSHDGSAQTIRDEFPLIQLISLSENKGFAIGNNIGIDLALQTNSDYIFLLNNDATVEPDTLSILADTLESNQDCSAVAPFILYADNPDLIWFGGGVVNLWLGWIGHKYLRRKYISGQYHNETTDYLTGCAMLIRASTLKLCRGFSPEYGLYAEDVDLSLRLREYGELRVNSNALVYHKISASSGGALSPFKAFHRGRSTALLFRKWTRYYHWITLSLLGFIGLIFYSFVIALKGRPGSSVALINGVFAGMTDRKIPTSYFLPYMSN